MWQRDFRAYPLVSGFPRSPVTQPFIVSPVGKPDSFLSNSMICSCKDEWAVFRSLRTAWHASSKLLFSSKVFSSSLAWATTSATMTFFFSKITSGSNFFRLPQTQHLQWTKERLCLENGDGSKPSDSKKISSATVDISESSTRAHSRRLLIKELPILFKNI